jgi:serine/threonine protein kinase
MIGEIVGEKYQVTRLLGGGGMGNVYEAVHTGTGRRVALKVIITAELAKNDVLVGRFQREAKAAGSIETEHIVQVLDTGVDPKSELPYMVMEFLDGEDVQKLVHTLGPVAPDLALRIVAQACLGLQKAHEAGVVHRDVKPANLFLTKRDGEQRLVKLLDFGIAKVKMEQSQSNESAGLTRTGSMLGSPLYMSPEQARGHKTIDHRADLWSLGVVLYELLTGRTPYHHIEALGELIIAICSEAPPPVQDFAPWVSPEVAAIINNALRLDPSRRFQSASEMYQACKALLPYGHTIDEGMLKPLDESERAVVAERLQVSADFSAQRPASPSMISMPPPPMSAGPVSTSTTGAGAVSQSEASPGTQPKKSSFGAVAVGALALLGLGGFGVLKVMQKDPPPPVVAASPPSAPAPPPTPVASVTPAPTITPSVVAPAVDSAPRTVSLVIYPDDAKVEIDDKPIELRSGLCDLTGPLGSKHKVKISKGKKERVEFVAITDSGALPPKLELEKDKSGATTGPGTKPGGTAAPVAPTGKPGLDTKFDD